MHDVETLQPERRGYVGEQPGRILGDDADAEPLGFDRDDADTRRAVAACSRNRGVGADGLGVIAVPVAARQRRAEVFYPDVVVAEHRSPP
jgi:hypothetical protein